MACSTCRPRRELSPTRSTSASGARRRTRRAPFSPRPSSCTRASTWRSSEAAMILMIDNYDSFTYNLVQYLGELGEDVRVVRNDELGVEAIAALAPERIVISPGPCTPNEAGVSVDLIRAMAGRIPVLGVCLRHQAIGQA